MHRISLLCGENQDTHRVGLEGKRLSGVYPPEGITTIGGVRANFYPLQLEGPGRADTVKLKTYRQRLAITIDSPPMAFL